jgi:hypothetical protein
VVSLTDEGREVLGRCRRDIRGMEAGLLAALDPAVADTTVQGLIHLAAAVRPRPTGNS